jgi:hypothetical protein
MDKKMRTDKRSFNEFMSEKKIADRWLILKVALAGVFVGVVAMYAFMLFGFLE